MLDLINQKYRANYRLYRVGRPRNEARQPTHSCAEKQQLVRPQGSD